MSLDSPGTNLGLYPVDKVVGLYGSDVAIPDSDLGGTAVHIELQVTG